LILENVAKKDFCRIQAFTLNNRIVY